MLAHVAPAARYQVKANIRYAAQSENRLDILQAGASTVKNRTGVLFIHGGGWTQGKKEDYVQQFCAPFLEHGFVVANIEYRLAGTAPAPAAVNDALAAARWFHDHASDFGVTSKEICEIYAGISDVCRD